MDEILENIKNRYPDKIYITDQCFKNVLLWDNIRKEDIPVKNRLYDCKKFVKKEIANFIPSWYNPIKRILFIMIINNIVKKIFQGL